MVELEVGECPLSCPLCFPGLVLVLDDVDVVELDVLVSVTDVGGGVPDVVVGAVVVLDVLESVLRGTGVTPALSPGVASVLTWGAGITGTVWLGSDVWWRVSLWALP